ncbi:hypothetical protein N3K66_008001 [Trichothecium roseum]|uniref:Uncharacterized protein n=1 Tax=Trichothecium roseum TaxID=47278 RepID=A0ACC0UTX6_9HYPO|nr:hypothetical protein N3K66_008001 [Trichothecium roseum]
MTRYRDWRLHIRPSQPLSKTAKDHGCHFAEVRLNQVRSIQHLSNKLFALFNVNFVRGLADIGHGHICRAQYFASATILADTQPRLGSTWQSRQNLDIAYETPIRKVANFLFTVVRSRATKLARIPMEP